MANKHFYFSILFSFSFCLFGTAQKINNNETLPDDFSEKSFEHVLNISNFGIHSAGTVKEKQVANYVFEELTQLGIKIIKESFDFESFDIIETNLLLNDKDIKPLQICFNPYVKNFVFEGDFLLLDSNNTTSSNIKNKIVIASSPLKNSEYFQLFFGSPKLIIVIPTRDFQKITNQKDRIISCTIKGENRKYTSQNVVGFLPGKQNTDQEIILSAHYDSYPSSIGADDNASGVGVLIELAKYFIQNPVNINLKFVAFGGEEKGLLGSRAFLNKHTNELSECKLLFNLDQLGGEQIFVETTGGIHGISEIKGKSQFPECIKNRSLEGIESNWRLLAPELLPIFAINNRPKWLEDIIKDSAAELSIPVTFAGNTGSDQMTFAQAGIVASAIGTSGNEVHSPKDIPSQINKKSLVDCGNIVVKIVIKTAEK
jgi:hypothetical protein